MVNNYQKCSMASSFKITVWDGWWGIAFRRNVYLGYSVIIVSCFKRDQIDKDCRLIGSRQVAYQIPGNAIIIEAMSPILEIVL